MLKAGPAKKLIVTVNEADRWNGRSVYNALLELFRHQGLAGATVSRAIAGFTGRGSIQTIDLTDGAMLLPIRIEVGGTARFPEAARWAVRFLRSRASMPNDPWGPPTSALPLLSTPLSVAGVGATLKTGVGTKRQPVSGSRSLTWSRESSCKSTDLLEPRPHVLEDIRHPALDHDAVPDENRQDRDAPVRPEGQSRDGVCPERERSAYR
jgi:PII-like signaling protein